MCILLLPWIAVVDIVILIILIIKRCRTIYIAIAVILLLAINLYGHIFAIPTPSTNSKSSDSERLSVLSWNIDGLEYDPVKISRILETIKEYDPDLIYLAEDFYACCDSINQQLITTYPYTSHRVCNENHYFYSKYPLGQRQWIGRDIDTLAVVVKSSILIKDKTIDLFGCHLSSNNYGVKRSLHPNGITDITSLTDYVVNINNASNLRKQELELVSDSMSSNHNALVMGDLNDIYGSKGLNVLRSKGLSDAWWVGGFGYGATIHRPAPYRIDYLFYNRKYLKLTHIEKINANGLSDHDALYAEFTIIPAP